MNIEPADKSPVFLAKQNMVSILDRCSPLPAILLLAATLRIAIGLAFPNYIVPDEIYQYLGQAHRLVFGHGYIPWEFRVGLRSWLIPLALALPMAAARLVVSSPAFGLAVIRTLLSIASLSVVVCAALWGLKFDGKRGAWLAGLAAALWPDLWVMAPHPLEGALAAYVLLPALFLIEPVGSAELAPSFCAHDSTRRIATAATLLGVAFVLRNALAPAIAVAGMGLCRNQPRRWLVGVSAGAVPVVLAGLLDWITWGTPFRSFWLNLQLNGVDNVGIVFGHEGWTFYPAALLEDWLWATPMIALTVAIGARRLPITTLTAATIFLTYSMFGHKELRFLFPMIALLVPVAGVGLVRLSRHLPAAITATAAIVSLVGMLSSPIVRFELANFVPSSLAEMALAHFHPKTVGAASRFMPSNLYFGAHTRLVAIPPARDFSGLDGLVIPQGRLPPPSSYHLIGCFGPIINSKIAARFAPAADCAWITKHTIPSAPTQPFGGFMIFPHPALRYKLDKRRQIP